MLRALKSGELVGLVSDRDLVGNGVEVEFFGERTTLPGGAATLALRTGCGALAGDGLLRARELAHWGRASAPRHDPPAVPCGPTSRA